MGRQNAQRSTRPVYVRLPARRSGRQAGRRSDEIQTRACIWHAHCSSSYAVALTSSDSRTALQGMKVNPEGQGAAEGGGALEAVINTLEQALNMDVSRTSLN
jgi:hypothetical protein